MKIIQRELPTSKGQFESCAPILEQVYRARGISQQNELNRTLSVLPSPDTFKDMGKAVDLLEAAIREQQRVLVVGDFDADGATSATLSVLALRAMGLNSVDYLVPNRFEYGYGLTPEIVELARASQPQLIITVDNGISSIDGVKAAKDLGINVLITDHHLPGKETPQADAIINPNQRGCEFVGKNLAGVGVAFYVMSALRARLRAGQWFSDTLPEPNMADFLDLVALGTVADVVPLDKINRALVFQGLQRIQAGKCRPGIRALLEVAGKEAAHLVATDLGFSVGPRLNAAGRLDDMSIGIQCLLESDYPLSREYALQLDELNRDRRVIEAGMQREGEAIVSQLDFDKEGLPWGLCLFDEGWHQGVVGLLASRLKEKTHRPVIAFAVDDQGSDTSGEMMLKGSGRSIEGLHIRDALDAVATSQPGLVSKFGGHAMAAGLSLSHANLERFKEAFDKEVRKQLDASQLQALIWTDGELPEQAISQQTAQAVREAGPWGQRFPEPVFEGVFHLIQQRIVGDKHLKLMVAPAGQPQQPIDAIAFNVDTTRWPDPAVTSVKLVYKLDINRWRGRESLQLLVEYLEPAGEAVN